MSARLRHATNERPGRERQHSEHQTLNIRMCMRSSSVRASTGIHRQRTWEGRGTLRARTLRYARSITDSAHAGGSDLEPLNSTLELRARQGGEEWGKGGLLTESAVVQTSEQLVVPLATHDDGGESGGSKDDGKNSEEEAVADKTRTETTRVS